MLSKDEIQREVKRLEEKQPWWHDIELPFGIRTQPRSAEDLRPNHNTVKWSKIKPHLELKDKSVLDVGCNEGYYCIEAHNSAASHVVGVDINEYRIEKAKFVFDVFGINDITLIQKSVYDLTPELLGGKFDIIFCLALLHRVPDPFGVISGLAEIGDAIVLEWLSWNSDEPIMRFWAAGHKSYDTHNSGYWRISSRCIMEMLWRCGFVKCRHIDETGSRTIIIASKNYEANAFKALDSCSWISLDELVNNPPSSVLPEANERFERPTVNWLKKSARRLRSKARSLFSSSSGDESRHSE